VALDATGPVPRDDASAALAEMKATAGALAGLHAIVRCEERVGEELKGVRFVECWIDVPHGRVRTELREKGKASPKLVAVASPTGMRVQQLECDDVAELKRPFDLPTALAGALAGELLSTAFRGDLLTFKASAYGKPELAGREKVDGVDCTRVSFSGNGEAQLWIGAADHLPRRIRGPLPRSTLEETIVRLEPAPDLSHVEFEIPVPEGRRLPDPKDVQARWREPPPEDQRWPKAEDDAPLFAAVDLEARVRTLGELAEEEAVVAFWTVEDERSVELAGEAERAWKTAASKLRFLHVAAGEERAPVASAVAKQKLEQPVWVAGSHPRDAFRVWRIWTCPVFVRLSDLQVVAVTRDLSTVRAWVSAN
jgi:hypothetical protein